VSPLMSENCPQCGGNLASAIAAGQPGDQVLCPYCGTRLIRTGQASGRGAPPAAGGAFAQGMRLKSFAYHDAQGLGREAFRMLIPVDWEFVGGIQWRMDNPGMPAVAAFQVRNPAGLEAFEVLPTLSFYWSNDPFTHMTFPRGSRYFGNEVQPPVGILQALNEIVIPRYRQGVGPIELVRQEPLPDLPEQLRAVNPNAIPGTSSAEGARVRISYPWEGQSIEEEIYGVVVAQRVATPSLMGTMEMVFWVVDYLFSFRALKDKLDGMADLFQAILYSFRLNPDWFAGYMQVSQMMIQNQIQHIHQIGQVSRMISQTSDQIRQMSMDSYYQRQATMDRLATNFSQAIRGVDEYQDPFAGRGVELPGGYGHAWANALGEYIVTEDPNFNPNLGSTLNWQPMTRQS